MKQPNIIQISEDSQNLYSFIIEAALTHAHKLHNSVHGVKN